MNQTAKKREARVKEQQTPAATKPLKPRSEMDAAEKRRTAPLFRQEGFSLLR